MVSANPQFNCIAPAAMRRRSSRIFCTWRCRAKPSGTVFTRSANERSRDSGTRVSPGAFPVVPEVRPPVDEKRTVRFVHQRQGDMLAGGERVAIVVDHALHRRAVDDALAHQATGIQLPGGRMDLDLLVHQRLRLHRILGLVVAAAPVADEIDDHVLAELHAVVGRQAHGEQAGFRVVAVDVQDGRADHLRDFGAVLRGACVVQAVRGEADLVVDDDVHRAADVVARVWDIWKLSITTP